MSISVLGRQGKQDQKQADRGLIHSLPSSLKQSFNNLHREEEENV